MKRTPRGFVPPPRKTGEPVAGLYTEPEEEMLLLGEMLYDATTMSELLGTLPFDKDGYRANLRIVRGAAVRMADRCARLLDEVADPKTRAPFVTGLSAAIESPDDEARRIFESMAESPNLIKQTEIDLPRGRQGNSDGEPGSTGASEAEVQGDRKNGRGRPSLNNRGPEGSLPSAPAGKKGRSTAVPIEGGLKAAIVGALKTNGPMTATELVDQLTESNTGVRPQTVHETLAKMRVSKEVLHNRVMGRIYNRLA